MGVDFYKPTRKWRARVTRNGRPYYLGHFLDLADAERAVVTAHRLLPSKTPYPPRKQKQKADQ